MSFSYLSVCSGLEGTSLAFEGLGATPVGFSEIEAFPSAIIAHRYGSNLPGEALSRNAPPNYGDFTTIDPASLGRVDVLMGGTPCQAFSIAGKRLSLADARGNLTLAYAVLAHELVRFCGLKNAFWENVPGVLSAEDNAFGCFLGVLVGADAPLLPSPRPSRGRSNDLWRWREAGRWPVLDDEGNETGEFVEREEGHIPRWPRSGMVAGPRARAAWRVLDAQYFGVPQRRERVLLIVDFGNGADPIKVLFEPKGVRGNTPPRREKGEGVADSITASSGKRGGVPQADAIRSLIPSTGDISHCLNAGGMGRQDFETETLIAHALRAEGFDASEDGTGRGTPIVPVCFDETQITSQKNRSNPQPDDPSHPLAAGARPPTIVFSCKDHGTDATNDLAPTMRAMPHNESHSNAGGQLAVCFQSKASEYQSMNPGIIAPTLDVAKAGGTAVAFDLRGREGGAQFEGPHDTANIRAANGGSSRSYVAERWAVRRLTPTECERLQGVPDGYTAIPWRGKDASDCPDGPRYKALGNSWAVPVVRWIGERLARELKLTEFDSVFGPPEAWK